MSTIGRTPPLLPPFTLNAVTKIFSICGEKAM